MSMNTNDYKNSIFIKEELQKIKKGNNPVMTGVKIRYSNKVSIYDVYKIPLNLLVYNKDNGRIGTRVKSHEKQIGPISEYTNVGSNLIEKYIIESKRDRNDKTLESLAKNGQLKHGIVTSEGIIVDGNRRASLLNELYRNRDDYSKKYSVKNLDFTEYFLAIILNDDVTKKEIHRLETEVQMGEDEKVDYNPIEKYLKCRDLREDNFTPSEIGNMMGENTQKVNQWLEILELMDDYLLYLNYDGIYTLLDKREDMFITLQKDLKKLSAQKGYANWAYSKRDIAKLKSVGFDYIRAQYEGKEFRNLAKSGNKDKIDGIFTDEDTWKKFYENHSESMKKIQEESVEEVFTKVKGSDFVEALDRRDKDYYKQVNKGFNENIKRQSNKIEMKLANDEPYILMKDALERLESIDTDSVSFYASSIYDLNSQMMNILDKFRFKLQKKGVGNE